MKKILSLVTLCMICLLSACSLFSTLDTDGNVTITHDYIEMKTVNYEHTSQLITGIQTITVQVSFENTKNKEVEFILENSFKVNKKESDDKEVIIPISLEGLFSGKTLSAGQKLSYTFKTTFPKETNVEDYELNFDINGKTITVGYKNKL